MFLLGLGGVLGIGAACEILLAADPGLLPPEASEIPFMAAHRTSWLLRGWVLCSNVVTLVCAVTLVRAAIALGRGQPRGWRHVRIATATVAAIAVGGILVCLPYLLPLPTGPTAEASQFMVVSVLSAGGGLALVCLLLSRHAQRAALRSAAG